MHSHAVITGRAAASYDVLFARWILPPLYRAVAAELAAAVPASGEVLDVGTGPGRLPLELARRRPDLRLAAVDPSADMVTRARQLLGEAGMSDRSDVRIAAAEELPFPDRAFDAVVSTLSAHHWADLPAAVAEQARVLRPGGRLWVYDLRGRTGQAAMSAAVNAAFGAAPVTAGEARLGWLTRRLIGSWMVTKPG